MLGGGNAAWTLRHNPCPRGIFSLANSSARGELVAAVRQHGWGRGVVGAVGVRGISGRGDRRLEGVWGLSLILRTVGRKVARGESQKPDHRADRKSVV